MKNIKNSFVLWARQYSKRILAVLLVLWGIGAVVGGVYEYIRLFISPETASMDAFYIYLAAPLTCGIPSYIIPNIYLNIQKIKKQYIPDYDTTILNGMPSEYGVVTDSGCNTETTEDGGQEYDD